jgi:hypothetical protein
MQKSKLGASLQLTDHLTHGLQRWKPPVQMQWFLDSHTDQEDDKIPFNGSRDSIAIYHL